MTPTLFLTTTKTTTRGLGAYILEALGPGSSATTSTFSSTFPPTGPHYFSNATSPPPSDNAFENDAPLPPHMTTSSNTSDSAAQTYCYTFTSKCFTDITYSSISVEPTGTGSSYATRCSLAQSSYSAVSTSWASKHDSVSDDVEVLGGTSYTEVTYYQDATTLCDGHPRVTYSPAIALSSSYVAVPGTPTATTTYHDTVGWMFPVSSPTCSIQPSDCDPLWSAYSTSVSSWSAAKTNSAASAQITQSPEAPSCANSSAVAQYSSVDANLHACGPCTIFGQGVQLLYFPVPTNVSRDMCASTPSATKTWFDDDVVSIYNGYNNSGPVETPVSGSPSATVVYDGKTFTSGTAYISIESVWTGDRCTASMGSPVTDAILAMPSESVLSLRNSQNHFEYFFSVSTVTGYPFDFADMNRPIPYSAWVGQQMCEYENDPRCNVIYENGFNPQLAMPPGIKKLRPEWAQCQMWYGGLYDPPMALTPGTAIAVATLPGAAKTTSASPSPSVKPSTPVSTAAAQTTKDSASSYTAGAVNPNRPSGDDTGAASAVSIPATRASSQIVSVFTTIVGLPIGKDTSESGAVTFADKTIRPGGPDTIIGGTRISAASDGIVVNGVTAAYAGETGSASDASLTEEALVNIGGSTVTAHYLSGSSNIAIIGSATLTAGGSAQTLQNGEIISLGPGGIYAQKAASTVSRGAAITLSSGNDHNEPAAIITASFISSGPTPLAILGSITLAQNGPAQTLPDGELASLAPAGIVLMQEDGQVRTVPQDATAALATITLRPAPTASATAAGGSVITPVYTIGADATPLAILADVTLTQNGAPQTLADGEVVSYGTQGLVVSSATTTDAFSKVVAVPTVSASSSGRVTVSKSRSGDSSASKVKASSSSGAQPSSSSSSGTNSQVVSSTASNAAVAQVDFAAQGWWMSLALGAIGLCFFL